MWGSSRNRQDSRADAARAVDNAVLVKRFARTQEGITKRMNPKVLIVMHDPWDLFVTTVRLTRMGCLVFSARSGRTAFRYWEDHGSQNVPFDLVLIDRQMDWIGGVEFVRLVKAHQVRHQHRSIAIVAVCDATAHPQDVLDEGFSWFVKRPLRQHQDTFAQLLLPEHLRAPSRIGVIARNPAYDKIQKNFDSITQVNEVFQRQMELFGMEKEIAQDMSALVLSLNEKVHQLETVVATYKRKEDFMKQTNLQDILAENKTLKKELMIMSVVRKQPKVVYKKHNAASQDSDMPSQSEISEILAELKQENEDLKKDVEFLTRRRSDAGARRSRMATNAMLKAMRPEPKPVYNRKREKVLRHLMLAGEQALMEEHDVNRSNDANNWVQFDQLRRYGQRQWNDARGQSKVMEVDAEIVTFLGGIGGDSREMVKPFHDCVGGYLQVMDSSFGSFVQSMAKVIARTATAHQRQFWSVVARYTAELEKEELALVKHVRGSAQAVVQKVQSMNDKNFSRATSLVNEADAVDEDELAALEHEVAKGTSGLAPLRAGLRKGGVSNRFHDLMERKVAQIKDDFETKAAIHAREAATLNKRLAIADQNWENLRNVVWERDKTIYCLLRICREMGLGEGEKSQIIDELGERLHDAMKIVEVHYDDRLTQVVAASAGAPKEEQSQVISQAMRGLIEETGKAPEEIDRMLKEQEGPEGDGTKPGAEEGAEGAGEAKDAAYDRRFRSLSNASGQRTRPASATSAAVSIQEEVLDVSNPRLLYPSRVVHRLSSVAAVGDVALSTSPGAGGLSAPGSALGSRAPTPTGGLSPPGLLLGLPKPTRDACAQTDVSSGDPLAQSAACQRSPPNEAMSPMVPPSEMISRQSSPAGSHAATETMHLEFEVEHPVNRPESAPGTPHHAGFLPKEVGQPISGMQMSKWMKNAGDKRRNILATSTGRIVFGKRIRFHDLEGKWAKDMYGDVTLGIDVGGRIATLPDSVKEDFMRTVLAFVWKLWHTPPASREQLLENVLEGCETSKPPPQWDAAGRLRGGGGAAVEGQSPTGGYLEDPEGVSLCPGGKRLNYPARRIDIGMLDDVLPNAAMSPILSHSQTPQPGAIIPPSTGRTYAVSPRAGLGMFSPMRIPSSIADGLGVGSPRRAGTPTPAPGGGGGGGGVSPGKQAALGRSAAVAVIDYSLPPVQPPVQGWDKARKYRNPAARAAAGWPQPQPQRGSLGLDGKAGGSIPASYYDVASVASAALTASRAAAAAAATADSHPRSRSPSPDGSRLPVLPAGGRSAVVQQPFTTAGGFAGGRGGVVPLSETALGAYLATASPPLGGGDVDATFGRVGGGGGGGVSPAVASLHAHPNVMPTSMPGASRWEPASAPPASAMLTMSNTISPPRHRSPSPGRLQAMSLPPDTRGGAADIGGLCIGNLSPSPTASRPASGALSGGGVRRQRWRDGTPTRERGRKFPPNGNASNANTSAVRPPQRASLELSVGSTSRGGGGPSSDRVAASYSPRSLATRSEVDVDPDADEVYSAVEAITAVPARDRSPDSQSSAVSWPRSLSPEAKIPRRHSSRRSLDSRKGSMGRVRRASFATDLGAETVPEVASDDPTPAQAASEQAAAVAGGGPAAAGAPAVDVGRGGGGGDDAPKEVEAMAPQPSASCDDALRDSMSDPGVATLRAGDAEAAVEAPPPGREATPTSPPPRAVGSTPKRPTPIVIPLADVDADIDSAPTTPILPLPASSADTGAPAVPTPPHAGAGKDGDGPATEQAVVAPPRAATPERGPASEQRKDAAGAGGQPSLSLSLSPSPLQVRPITPMGVRGVASSTEPSPPRPEGGGGPVAAAADAASPPPRRRGQKASLSPQRAAGRPTSGRAHGSPPADAHLEVAAVGRARAGSSAGTTPSRSPVGALRERQRAAPLTPQRRQSEIGDVGRLEGRGLSRRATSWRQSQGSTPSPSRRGTLSSFKKGGGGGGGDQPPSPVDDITDPPPPLAVVSPLARAANAPAPTDAPGTPLASAVPVEPEPAAAADCGRGPSEAAAEAQPASPTRDAPNGDAVEEVKLAAEGGGSDGGAKQATGDVDGHADATSQPTAPLPPPPAERDRTSPRTPSLAASDGDRSPLDASLSTSLAVPPADASAPHGVRSKRGSRNGTTGPRGRPQRGGSIGSVVGVGLDGPASSRASTVTGASPPHAQQQQQQHRHFTQRRSVAVMSDGLVVQATGQGLGQSGSKSPAGSARALPREPPQLQRQASVASASTLLPSITPGGGAVAVGKPGGLGRYGAVTVPSPAASASGAEKAAGAAVEQGRASLSISMSDATMPPLVVTAAGSSGALMGVVNTKPTTGHAVAAAAAAAGSPPQPPPLQPQPPQPATATSSPPPPRKPAAHGKRAARRTEIASTAHLQKELARPTGKRGGAGAGVGLAGAGGVAVDDDGVQIVGMLASL